MPQLQLHNLIQLGLSGSEDSSMVIYASMALPCWAYRVLCLSVGSLTLQATNSFPKALWGACSESSLLHLLWYICLSVAYFHMVIILLSVIWWRCFFFINSTLLHLDSAEALNTFKLLKIVIINFSCLYRFWIIFSPSTSHLHMVRENGGNWQHSYNNGSFPIIFTHFMY